MSKCRDCSYVCINNQLMKNRELEIAVCSLSNLVVRPDVEHNCSYSNLDLTEFDICYNCKHYLGGRDWGLFCSHKNNYHHLGNFNDKPCQGYVRR